MSQAHCPICADAARRPVLRVRTAPGSALLLRCAKCRLIQPEMLPAASELRAYYDQYSYSDPATWTTDPATLVSLRQLARTFNQYRTSGRLLDIGCGTGALLRAMSAQGWLAEGQEISATAADRLEEEGFRIHRNPVEHLECGEAPFDVIVMSEVVEHLPAPQVALSSAYRLLRPGGALYLTTPNFGSLSRRVLNDRWRAIELPEHISYFDNDSLSRFLAGAGFRRVRAWSEGLDPYELIRARGRQSSSEAASARSRRQSLRAAAAVPGVAQASKHLVNFCLRLTDLGDTLKALAEK